MKGALKGAKWGAILAPGNLIAAGLFKSKMELYEEFRKNNEYDLIKNYLDPKYEEYYLSGRYKAVCYKESELEKHIDDKALEGKLSEKILKEFHPGDRYSMLYIKRKLKEFHRELGITKKAKATDLSQFFKLTKTKITMSDKTLKDGFKLEKL